MTYAKPELVLLADARVAIRSGDGSPHHKDGETMESIQVNSESAAYEADE